MSNVATRSAVTSEEIMERWFIHWDSFKRKNSASRHPVLVGPQFVTNGAVWATSAKNAMHQWEVDKIMVACQQYM